MRILCCLLLITAVAAPAFAGPSTGSQLTASTNTLWLYGDDDGQWMSNSQDDGGDRYSGMGATSPWVAPPYVDALRFDFPLAPAPSKEVKIDTSQSAAATIYVGAPSFTDPTGIVTGPAAGYISVWIDLTVDGELMLDSEFVESPFLGGMVEFTWDLTPLLDTIPAGAEVVLSVFIDGAGTNAFVGTAEDWGWSNIVLPVVGGDGPAPPPTDEGSEGPETSTSTSTSTTATSTTQPPTTTEPATTTSSTTGNGTETAGPLEVESSPAAAFALVSGGLLAVVAVLRRRLKA